jgi:HAD superfamily hydrolase (TIGR01509 family)
VSRSSSPDSRDRAARLALTLVFLGDGLLLGSWAARIPAIQDAASLTNTELGVALFAASVGALIAMPVTGRLSARFGSRDAAVLALLGGAASLLLISVATSATELAAALFVFGAGFGAVNVAANAQGLALEKRYGRPILASLHAAFSGGGLAGAGLGALAAGASLAPRPHFGLVALALAAAALASRTFLLPDGSTARTATLARPPRILLVLGAAAFCCMLAEGAAADWSAVYLSGSVGAAAAVAALGYTAFSLAMAASRLVGDRLAARLGPVALVRTGGLLAAAGLGAGLVIPSAAVSLAGFCLMGAGLGVVIPVLFRAAGTTPGISASIGVAAVSTIGWFGFLAGPPAIGFAAGAIGLRGALGIVVAAAIALALLAGSAAPSGARSRTGFRGLVIEPVAVLSDLDGVLVDSSGSTDRSWRRFAERHRLDPEHVIDVSSGRRTADAIRVLAPALDAGAEAAEVERAQAADSGDVRALPGARELIGAIPADRFAIVTSGPRSLAVARLRAAGLPVPDVMVTGEQVDAGKPDPQGYLRAAAALGVAPAHCLVLEDAPVGIQAGLSAGMTVVGVTTTHAEDALEAAHVRVRDLAALLPGRATGFGKRFHSARLAATLGT